MAPDASPVIVQTNDTIDTIIARIRAVGAPLVQLVVPEGFTALQTLAGFAELRLVLARDAIDLLVISEDEKIVAAARRLNFETLEIGSTMPSAARPIAVAAASASPARPNGRNGATIVLPETLSEDARLLDLIERMPTDDPYVELGLPYQADDLLDDAPPAPSYYPADDLPAATAAALDEDWDTDLDDAGAIHDSYAHPAPAPESARASAASAPVAASTALDRQRTRSGEVYLPPPAPSQAARRNPWMLLVPLLLVALVVAGAALWYLNGRTTVTIYPPPDTANNRTFTNEIIPLNESDTPNPAAIQAQQVSTDADVTVEGTAQLQAMPVGVARGGVTIYNALGQPFNLPEGTEFVGRNPQGQQVRFLIDAPITVPQAVTVATLAGSTTTNGRADAAITARSPGSASNIPESSIIEIDVPGQAPITSGGQISFTSGPISGGSEEQVYIVTQKDVEAVLGDALSKLYAVAGEKLAAKANGATIDPSTIYPDPTALGEASNYEVPVITPPVGQQTDQNSPTFKVMVRSQFDALATPADQPIARQLATVAPTYFQQRGSLPPCDEPSIAVERQHWDGKRLMIDGAISCKPNPNLPVETISKVRTAIRGQTREAAAAGLDELQRQGVIGGYKLPERATLPGLDLLLNLVTTQAPADAPTQEPATPAVTPGA